MAEITATADHIFDSSDNIAPIRVLDEAAALEWVRAQPGGRTKLPAAELTRRWGWPAQRAGRRLRAWAKAGIIKRRGKAITIASNDVAPRKLGRATSSPRFTSIADMAAYSAAIALAGVAAVFSIRGMVVLFSGAPLTIIAMAIAMESAKLVTAGWLAARWRETSRIWRLVLAALVVGLAVINAVGVFSQLVVAHVGERGAAQAAVEMQDAGIAARIELAASKVADLDRRLGQIDGAVEGAAKRGRTNVALSAMEGQHKARAALVSERNEAAATLASLKAERASVAAKGRQAEVEAAPIRYVAELIGIDTDPERAIRWLIALIVLCCDPLAIALCPATSARGS